MPYLLRNVSMNLTLLKAEHGTFWSSNMFIIQRGNIKGKLGGCYTVKDILHGLESLVLLDRSVENQYIVLQTAHLLNWFSSRMTPPTSTGHKGCLKYLMKIKIM